MASYNRVILVGNLTRDPELRYIPSGTAVANVGLAVSDRRKDQSGEWVEEVTFVDITMWGRTAEVMNQYLSKGKPVFIEGRLKLDQWQDKDGGNRSKMKVVIENFQFIDSKGGGGGGNDSHSHSDASVPAGASGASGAASSGGGGEHHPVGEDDIPF